LHFKLVVANNGDGIENGQEKKN